MRTLILVIVLTSGALAQSQPASSLDAARELYASADYRRALEMLDRLAAADSTRPERPSIDLYRAFCLIALERAGEADEAIVAMITRDLLYRPADAEVPPRLRPMFSDKRRVVLPGVIQKRYERAKTAYEKSDYKAAADGFTQVLSALSDPEIAREASRPPLADLRVLSVGFKDLAVRALTPSPAAAPAPAPPSPAATAASGVDAPKPVRIFDSNDLDVVPPVSVKQDIPRVQRPVLVERTGVLFIVIDERGGVESAIITEPLDRTYDSTVLAAARTWTYQPAMRNGVPVKYRKRIQLTLPRQTN
jgi:hypothetical protein